MTREDPASCKDKVRLSLTTPPQTRRQRDPNAQPTDLLYLLRMHRTQQLARDDETATSDDRNRGLVFQLIPAPHTVMETTHMKSEGQWLK